jgi:MraZ protein
MNLRGNYPAKVDDKGRLKIPAVYLEQLKAFGNQFYITSPTGDSARIYPISVWQAIEEKLSKVSSQNQAKRKFLMHTSYYGQMAEMDAQGRVLLPSILRDKAQTKGEVDVFGALDYLEVMNHAKVVDDMNKDPFTAGDFKALEDLGI